MSSRPSSRRRQAPSLRAAHHRLLGVLSVFGLLFALVVVHLVDLQVVRPDRYTAQGRRQRVSSSVLPAGRGSLLDRNGTELALSIPQRTIFADPSLIDDPEHAAKKLAPVLDLDREELEEDLQRSGRYVVLAHTVTDAVAEKVRALDLKGIASFDEFKRFNPGGDLAGSLIGQVSVDGGAGTSGLEKAYNDVLNGRSGSITFERSKSGGTIAGGQRHLVPARPGSDLVLTIDQSLQYQTQEVLAQAVRNAKSKGGIAIVTRTGTGEVLAMANMVTDAETGEVRPSSNNLALTTVYEPGSVNKVITVAGAIEEGIVKPQDSIFVPYSLQVGDHLYTDHDPHPDEDWSITDILAKSSNVGTIKLAQGLGPERVDDYLRSFGFGEKTALNFPAETRGIMLPLDEWSGTSIGSIPIGQGIAVTAMQMLAAFNVIANDGVYVAPRLVNAKIDTAGKRHDMPSSERRKVVSPETAQAVRAMMAEVVSRGTGTEAGVPGYTVAGKTGTARKPQPGGGYGAPGGYRYVSTFAGVVPAEQPELSIIVVIDEPGPGVSPFASDIAAPAFSQLARYALRQFKIPPLTQTEGGEAVDPAGDATAGTVDPPADGTKDQDAGDAGTDQPATPAGP